MAPLWHCPAPVERTIHAKTLTFFSEAMSDDGFSVRLAVYAIRSFQYKLADGSRYKLRRCREEEPSHIFVVNDPAELRTVDGCRTTLRRMMSEVPHLQPLDLSEDEWDTVMQEVDCDPLLEIGIMSQMVDVANGGGGHMFTLDMVVRRKIKYDNQLLLAACKEPPVWEENEDNLCAICLEDLAAGESAVELPNCTHAFHRHCIGVWSSKAESCPICRDNYVTFVLLNFFGNISDLTN